MIVRLPLYGCIGAAGLLISLGVFFGTILSPANGSRWASAINRVGAVLVLFLVPTVILYLVFPDTPDVIEWFAKQVGKLFGG
jgi:hypothetical protein